MDNNLGLRRKDTTKGPPLRILSLDGGGVRGYSMLILLQELMHRTFVETEGRAPKRHEIPKPCDHFDLIAGTGTGGLIAIMLGRLRLDLETCKDVYVRMTKRVFETDKTIAGIPYRSTLFKASKLEEAIKECVSQYTVYDDEGNDNLAKPGDLMSPMSARTPASEVWPQRSVSNASRYSVGSPVEYRGPVGVRRWGNPNALLYDDREKRCKTAVTAVYKGTPPGGSSILLRSYDSRKEPAPEFNCTIWQAGRATCATALAFKPIQIGQSVFLDEGSGKYNPAPQILDEAAVNEYPGRDVGVFVSIGTGKRPSGTNNQQHLWWEGFAGGAMGDFAEARRRLISKIEGCEDTHQYTLREHLSKRNVNPENYYRLNVEVGVGEFGMNEWARLVDISTNTRMYLCKPDVQRMNLEAAAKIARIHRAKIRHERVISGEYHYEHQTNGMAFQQSIPEVPPPSNPMAVELPAEDVMPMHLAYRPNPQQTSPQYQHRLSVDDKFTVVSSDEYPQPVQSDAMSTPPRQQGNGLRPRRSYDTYDSDPRTSYDSMVPAPLRSSADFRRYSPPPLPPKTPLTSSEDPQRPHGALNRPHPVGVLPYPDIDGPPPIVNHATKPEYTVR